MIEETLIQYGVLGLWTITLLSERYFYNKRVKELIENNTVAMTKMYEVMKKWETK